MFDNLPPNEKQAFFSILDEYFTARPHLLGGGQGEAAESSNAYTSAPPPAPRRSNAPPPPAARKPATVASNHSSISIPAGLTTSKAIGSIKTSSAGAAFGSMLKSNHNQPSPKTPGEAISGLHSAASRMNLGQRATPPPVAASVPSPPPPPPPQPAASHLGQAEVLYEYKGTEAEDLSVRQYDIINLIEKVNDDWWKAETGDGSRRSGLVPASYVKVL